MPKTFVFALTPLDNAFDDAYELGIKGACDEVGAYCERVDPAMYEGVIGDRIHILISKADIVVAEMSSQSPEVFYQTGYSHALGKPVILVTRDGGDIPFNLNQYAHIVYEDIAPLKSELVERLRWVMDNPGSDPAHAEFPLEFYLAGEALASVELPKVPMKSMTTSSGDGLKLKLDYHNGSERPFAGTFTSVPSLVPSTSALPQSSLRGTTPGQRSSRCRMENSCISFSLESRSSRIAGTAWSGCFAHPWGRRTLGAPSSPSG